MWLLEYLRLQTWLALCLSVTALVHDITPFFLRFNFQRGDCRKYSYFMFVNHLLCLAVFHVDLGTPKSYYYSTRKYYTVQVQYNSDSPADFSAGGMPPSVRLVKMSRVLEGLVRGENLETRISGQTCFCKRFLGIRNYTREECVALGATVVTPGDILVIPCTF